MDPPERTVSLREVGRWVLETRLKHMPAGIEDDARARLVANLGMWQLALGQREAARASSQHALAIFRRLAEEHPGQFLPYLASLGNMGMVEDALGQRSGPGLDPGSGGNSSPTQQRNIRKHFYLTLP